MCLLVDRCLQVAVVKRPSARVQFLAARLCSGFAAKAAAGAICAFSTLIGALLIPLFWFSASNLCVQGMWMTGGSMSLGDGIVMLLSLLLLLAAFCGLLALKRCCGGGGDEVDGGDKEKGVVKLTTLALVVTSLYLLSALPRLVFRVFYGVKMPFGFHLAEQVRVGFYRCIFPCIFPCIFRCIFPCIYFRAFSGAYSRAYFRAF